MHKSRQHESDWISIDRHDSTFNWPARSARTLQVSRKYNNLSSWIKYSEFWIIKSSICLTYASSMLWSWISSACIYILKIIRKYDNRMFPIFTNTLGSPISLSAPPTERSIIWRTRKGWQQLLADHLPRFPAGNRNSTFEQICLLYNLWISS